MGKTHTLFFSYVCAFMLLTNINVANACLGPPLHSSVFLKSLPVAAMNKSFIATIKIINDSEAKFQGPNDPESNTETVKIEKILHGNFEHETIKIRIPRHMCYNGHNLKAGEIYFIAGTIDENGTFSGEWKQQDLH